MTTAQRVYDLLLLPLLVIALAFEPNFRHGFMNYSESGQHLATMRELANGSLLFRDLFAQYGPLHYYVPTLFAGVFGESIATLRGYFLAGEIFGFLALWGLCRALIPNRIFATAAVIVAVMYAHHPFWSTRWGGFRFAFVYLSLWCLVALLRNRRPHLPVLAGAFAALAFLHTYDAGAAAAIAALACFGCLAAQPMKRNRLPMDLALYAAGAAACLLPFFIYLLATGTFGDYVAQLPLLNSGRAWIQPVPEELITATVIAPGLIYGMAIALCLWAIARKPSDAASLFGILVVTSSGLFFYAASFRAIRGPQFETSLPLVALVLFFMMSRAFGVFEAALEGRGNRAHGWLAFSFVLAGMLAVAGGEIRTYSGGGGAWASHQMNKGETVARHVGARLLNDAYQPAKLRSAGSARLPARQAREIEDITRYLRQVTAPEDSILGYPDLGIFNYFAGRPHATRFTIPILAAADPEWTAEILNDVRVAKPAVVLIGNQTSTLSRATGHEGEYLPELRALLMERYVLEQNFDRLNVYRLKPEFGP